MDLFTYLLAKKKGGGSVDTTDLREVMNMSGINVTSSTPFYQYAQDLYDGYSNMLKDKYTLINNMNKGISTGLITDAIGLSIYGATLTKLSTQEGTPTPENPVAINNVNGYVNLFNKAQSIITTTTVSVSELPTGVRVICKLNYTNIFAKYVVCDLTGYEGKTIKVNCHVKSGGSNEGRSYIRLGDVAGNNDPNSQSIGSDDIIDGELSLTMVVPNELDSTYHYLLFALYGTRETTAQLNDYVDYTDVRIVVSDTELPYIPYGNNAVSINVTDGNNSYMKPILLNNNEICGVNENNLDELTINKYGEVSIIKKTGKINSYNGETITTDYLSTTGGLDNGATIYYVLDTPQTINISDKVDLVLYDGNNTITNSEDMNMSITYIKDTFD